MTTREEELKREIESWKNSYKHYLRCDVCQDLLPETEIKILHAELLGIQEGKLQAQEDVLMEIKNIAKEEISYLKHEHLHPVNKALGEDFYNMELEIAEWEDFLVTFDRIIDKLNKRLQELKTK